MFINQLWLKKVPILSNKNSYDNNENENYKPKKETKTPQKEGEIKHLLFWKWSTTFSAVPEQSRILRLKCPTCLNFPGTWNLPLYAPNFLLSFSCLKTKTLLNCTTHSWPFLNRAYWNILSGAASLTPAILWGREAHKAVSYGPIPAGWPALLESSLKVFLSPPLPPSCCLSLLTTVKRAF